MDVDLLIIGQGIAGTFLSLEARRAGLSYIVLDDARPSSASRVASGLINPVTGKRVVTTWMAPELLAHARVAYADILGRSYIRETEMVSFFPGPDARVVFMERVAASPFLALPSDERDWSPFFNYSFGYGIIRPCALVDLSSLLDDVRADLRMRGLLLEAPFTHETLEPTGVRYGDIRARHLVFCDGMTGTSASWFGILPFSPSKGEALLLEIPDLPGEAVFKMGQNLVPLGGGRFWAGASYEWNYPDALPTAAFRTRTEKALREWLRVPFDVVDHVASIRPTTVEQKPFVGLHPVHPQIGILGGMGTKGCSLAPFFARQLVDHLTQGSPILGAADVGRYARMLSR
ncbi:NAD(P)/FAD-dependent oxidoreductase [Dinghuibacter silviterrae]|uniref:Glycine/D-amino acid oxidase-like deaminating enzyme n=1 Tax=Dinghuibacter silviterrae TaxID=1539049 RepID=A0A4R8DVF8_9BACT|nr:FAD-binding oxidoreductase [Dinghuibacter silviterrae]TDX02006.1 glycine/D-amino acid oxidase-like deaminating enzyme [Dinghuibacter silviterrae]